MFVDLFAAAKIGPSTSISFDNVTPVRLQLLTVEWRPTLFVLRATAACYIRQGGLTIGANDSSLLLLENTIFPICVEVESDSYISILGATTSGVLKATLTSRLT